MAEMLLGRALDSQAPDTRDSETVGLWIHTLVRQKRSAEAANALTSPGGKYCYTAPKADASSPPTVAADDGSSSTATHTLTSKYERAPDEDVLESVSNIVTQIRRSGYFCCHNRRNACTTAAL